MEKFSTPIKCKTFIRSAPQDVYRLITSGEGWDSWFTHGTRFKLEKESEILFSWKNWGADSVSVQVKGRIADFRENEFVQFYWNYGLDGGPTLVDLRVTAKDGGTLLSLTESGYPDTKSGHEMLVECATGWGEALTLIKIFLENKITFH